MKVEQFYNKNQFVIYGKYGIYFQSYESIVAEITEGGILRLGKDWNYSKTTLKHLCLFINDNLKNLNKYLYDAFYRLDNITNKKKYIQRLIDDKIIDVITL